MATAETAKLLASLDLDDARYQAGFSRANKTLGGFEQKTTSTFGRIKQGVGLGAGIALFNAGIGLATKGMSTFAGFVNQGVQDLNELQRVQAATAAVVKSTGGAAHVSASQVSELAGSIEDLTTIDDKTVQAGENMLLTFTNIRNEVGKGNDIFNQAVATTADLAVAMNNGNVEGVDLKGTAIQLGKALNDPIKGITALSRVGVTFTDQQKKQIKELVKHNDLLGAQKIILKELNREFGGAAQAQAGTYAAQQRRLSDALETLRINLVRGLLPGLTRASKALADLFKSKEFTQGATALGEAIGNALSPANIKGIAAFAREVLPRLADGLKLAGVAAKTMFDIWKSLPQPLQTLLIGGAVVNKVTGGALTGLLGGGLKGLVGGLRGQSPASPVYVSAVGGLGGAGGPSGGAGVAGAASRGRGIAGKLVGAVSLVSIVGDALAVYQTQQDQSKMNSEIAAGVQDTLKAFLKTKPTPEQLKTSLAGVEKGIRDIESNPLNVLVQGDALDKLRGMRTDLQRQIAKTEANTAQGRQIVAAVQAVGPSIGKAFNSGGIIGAIGGLIPYLQRIAIARTGVLLTTGPNKGRPSRAPLDPGDVNASAPTPGEKGRHLHGEGIKLTTTHRDNSNAATLHGRYGPTRSQAGAG